MKGINESEYKIALVANPFLDYPVDSIDSEKVPLKFIESNKLSLLLKEKGIETEASKKDERKLNYLLDELRELKHAFDEKKVDFVFIKFPELLRPQGDLDIVIINRLKDAENILKFNDYILDEDPDPYRKKYVKSVSETTWEVDLHLEAAWVGVMYLNKEEIWRTSIKRRINGVDVLVPSKEYELLIMAAHDMRSNEITLFDVLLVHSILHENTLDIDYVRAVAKKMNWLKQLDHFIHSTDEIYKDLYEAGNYTSEKELPFHFPFFTIGMSKLEKTSLDLRYRGIRRGFEDLKAHCYFDVPGYLKRIRK